MQTTTAPVASPLNTHSQARYRSRYITVEVVANVAISEIDTEDLIAELADRGHDGAQLPGGECARIATLHLCGQRAQAEREALALVLETAQLAGGAGQ